MEYATSQPADGHTLLVAASGQMAIAAAIYPKLPYHPTRTLIPLTMIANFPLILSISADHPAKTVKELVAWAKANPDKANYASSSPAFIIATELFKLKSGMPAQMIPYKSSNEMLLSVVGGQTLLTIADGPPTMPLVKGGKVRAVAVTGSERSPELPDVPSMAEAGFPDVDIKLWSGFFATPGTPPAIVNKLEAEIRRALADAGVQQKLKAMAVNPGGRAERGFPQDDRRRHPEIRRDRQGGEPEIRGIGRVPLEKNGGRDARRSFIGPAAWLSVHLRDCAGARTRTNFRTGRCGSWSASRPAGPTTSSPAS